MNSQVGQGRFSKTFEAEDTKHHKFYIKEVRIGDNEKLLEFTEEEIKKWIQLESHPNLVKYKDYNIDDGKIFIVSKPIEGESLEKKLENSRGPLPENFIVTVFLELVSALQILHENKIIHCDVKPKNIIITKEGDAVLVDFGIKWIVDDNLDTLKFAATNYFYLSPEMIKHRNYNHNADIWSLGATLYEMLTFNHPFGDNVFEICQNIEMENMIPIVANYSDDLRSLVKLMMVKVPSYRIPLKKLLRLPFFDDFFQADGDHDEKSTEYVRSKPAKETPPPQHNHYERDSKNRTQPSAQNTKTRPKHKRSRSANKKEASSKVDETSKNHHEE